MSNDLHSGDLHNNAGHGDYEREDFSTATIAGSLIGLVVMCAVSFVIVVGMYRYLEKTQMEHASANPMVPMKADTRHMTPGKNPGDEPMEVQAFPKPRLQPDDVQEMHDQLYSEEGRLQSYGWVDQDSGEARIPVARAMELIAERGLPVRSVASPDAAAAPPGAAQGKTKKAGP
jgi:hypothetical protein